MSPRRSRSLLALVGLCASFVGFAPPLAKANVIYTFHGTISGALNGSWSDQFVVTDAAVQSGSMNFTMSTPGDDCGPTSPPYQSVCQRTGDATGYVAFGEGINVAAWDPANDIGFGQLLDVEVTFNKNGTLTGGITDNDDSKYISYYGSQYDWSGSLSSDFYQSCDAGAGSPCFLSGYWSDGRKVPEPVTLSLFGTGLVGAVAMRRRKKKAA